MIESSTAGKSEPAAASSPVAVAREERRPDEISVDITRRFRGTLSSRFVCDGAAAPGESDGTGKIRGRAFVGRSRKQPKSVKRHGVKSNVIIHGDPRRRDRRSNNTRSPLSRDTRAPIRARLSSEGKEITKRKQKISVPKLGLWTFPRVPHGVLRSTVFESYCNRATPGVGVVRLEVGEPDSEASYKVRCAVVTSDLEGDGKIYKSVRCIEKLETPRVIKNSKKTE